MTAIAGCRGGCGEQKEPLRSTAGVSASARAEPAKVGTLAPVLLRVPRAGTPPKIDGKLIDDVWHSDARTHAFVDVHGEEARPFSEAHFLVGDGKLYLGLYAADQDIEARTTAHDAPLGADDAFHLVMRDPSKPDTKYTIDISATGIVTDARLSGAATDTSWESGIALAIDCDGTPNDPRDDDEEWVIEATIPLSAIGADKAHEIELQVSRCDTPKGATRACGSWGEGAAGAIAGKLEIDVPAPK